MVDIKYAVITCARNEADYIEKTIESMLAQSILPIIWIIVDDGSTDGTSTIVENLTRKCGWVRLVRRSDRGQRHMGAGFVQAFKEGLGYLNLREHEFLCNVDADVSFGAMYFEVLFQKFYGNPKLGIAGGQLFDTTPTGLSRMRELPEMTTGALKCWRTKCFAEFGGLVAAPGWDGIDCYRAMMLGWETKTFTDPDLRIVHLRQMGSSHRSVFQGRIRRGKAMYFIGAHPLWVLVSALFHAVDHPCILGSLCVIWGYFTSRLTKCQRYDDREFVNFLRKYQMRKILSFVRLK